MEKIKEIVNRIKADLKGILAVAVVLALLYLIIHI